MPEKSEILSRAVSLKGHCWAQEEELEGDARWLGREHGAVFKLIKPEGVVFEAQGDVSHLYLTLRGKAKGKGMLRQDFVDALGEPTLEVPFVRFRHPQILIWENSKALKA